MQSYETSNFSKPGFECAHNLKYWKGQEYLGLGVAASSFNGASRWTNATELDEYISNVGNGIKPADEMIFLSAADKKQEYIMLRLRLSEGINIIDYQNTFGTAFMAEHDSSVLWALNSGLVTVSNEFIKPTLKGFDLQNTLISEFMKNV